MKAILDWLRAHGVSLAIGGTLGITVGWGAWHQHYDVAVPERELVPVASAPPDAGAAAVHRPGRP